jgi:Zinc knuckle
MNTGPTFCDACKARVEWHLTHNGKSMPIDPDPHADGRFYFGAGLKLHVGRAGIRPRMYRCHWDTCAKGHDASKRALRGNYSERTDQCDKWDCSREDRHFHCFKCGETDHLSPDCPERVR